jgi:hypothetical protein
MGMMDNLGNNMDDMKARYNELSHKTNRTEAEDMELDRLRSQFE